MLRQIGRLTGVSRPQKSKSGLRAALRLEAMESRVVPDTTGAPAQPPPDFVGPPAPVDPFWNWWNVIDDGLGPVPPTQPPPFVGPPAPPAQPPPDFVGPPAPTQPPPPVDPFWNWWNVIDDGLGPPPPTPPAGGNP